MIPPNIFNFVSFQENLVSYKLLGAAYVTPLRGALSLSEPFFVIAFTPTLIQMLLCNITVSSTSISHTLIIGDEQGYTEGCPDLWKIKAFSD